MRPCSNKNCTQTNPQPLENFYPHKGHQDGLSSDCKTCCKSRTRAYQKKNHKKIYEETKEYRLTYNKKYREENPDYFKNYRKDPKNKILRKEYLDKNREKIRKSQARRTKNRFKSDPAFRAVCRVRNRIVKLFKEKPKFIKTLGCSFDTFKLFLESKFQPGMTWTNYGEWQIDHYFPLTPAYNLGPEVFAKACLYTNLRPMWKTANTSKNDTIPEEFKDIEKFLAS